MEPSVRSVKLDVMVLMCFGATVMLCRDTTVENTSLLPGNHAREGETIMSRGLILQEFFESLYEDTLGVSRPAVFSPAVTRFFSSVLFYLVKFTGQTRFDNH